MITVDQLRDCIVSSWNDLVKAVTFTSPAATIAKRVSKRQLIAYCAAKLGVSEAEIIPAFDTIDTAYVTSNHGIALGDTGMAVVASQIKASNPAFNDAAYLDRLRSLRNNAQMRNQSRSEFFGMAAIIATANTSQWSVDKIKRVMQLLAKGTAALQTGATIPIQIVHDLSKALSNDDRVSAILSAITHDDRDEVRKQLSQLVGK
jgi:hypothetical protein